MIFETIILNVSWWFNIVNLVFSTPVYLFLFFVIHPTLSKLPLLSRVFFYSSKTANFLLTMIGGCFGFRLIGNVNSLAVTCERSYFGPAFCCHGFNFFVALSITSCLLNIHVLYYNFLRMKLDPEQTQKLIIFSLFYIFPLVVLMINTIGANDFEKVYNETLSTHASYDFTQYGKFGGFTNFFYPIGTLLSLFTLVVILGNRVPRWERQINEKKLATVSINDRRGKCRLITFIPLFFFLAAWFSLFINLCLESCILIIQFSFPFLLILNAKLDVCFTFHDSSPYWSLEQLKRRINRISWIERRFIMGSIRVVDSSSSPTVPHVSGYVNQISENGIVIASATQRKTNRKVPVLPYTI